MVKQPTGEPEETPLGGLRHRFAADVDRATVVAEARLLLRELDGYLELISEWALEGIDD